MSLVINNNMMAANTARILGNTYASLSKSTQRLSSGLRINSAADDAAGLAIRELMRSDIATMKQGIRNAADGISLLQTAEGAMAVIDEKLTRMKELAEQAATGTYTTVQREIINSEYQAMAAEIDRIANSAEFNGVKLLDGSISAIHQGKGLKIHFGTGNSEAEDYYFINIGDIRATSQSGLRIAGDAKNDIWGTVGTHGGPNTTGCCGGGIPSLDQPVANWHSGEVFAYGYNWDWQENDDTRLNRGRYIAGAYQVGSGATLQQLLDMVNQGSQARVRVDFSAGTTLGSLVDGNTTSGAHRICFGNEIYYVGSATLGTQDLSGQKTAYNLEQTGPPTADLDTAAISALCLAINNNPNSEFWARIETDVYRPGYSSLYVFAKEGGDKKDVSACDEQMGHIRGSAAQSTKIQWYNDETETSVENGTYFGNGGKYWGTLKTVPTGYGSWGVRLEGKDVGKERDLWILNVGPEADADIRTDQASAWTGIGFGLNSNGSALTNLLGLDRQAFVEIQNAADGDWAGAHIRSQSHAQEALDAVQAAIEKKDKIRATLGAYQNRLENTITNLEIQAENLQASESRISDVDMATEMTTFVKNQVLTQAAISMLSQANSLPQMALSLLNG
ncbi:MAG: flagellin [Candidatus Adiutrix sp.]|jgi:flagellin|nr:flagellin [Candidatus Adiutrix sp.]